MKLEATFRNGLVEVTSSSIEDETGTFFVDHPLEAEYRKKMLEALSARLRQSGNAFLYMGASLERVILLKPTTIIAPLFEP